MIDGMITVTEASELAGCSREYICRLLREKKLVGKQLNERLWLVRKADVVRLSRELTTRSRKNREN